MKFDQTYMDFAYSVAKHSKAIRAKVGAVIVTSNGILLPGYNGTATLTDNICEDENGKTKIEVIHAELNCIIKAAKEGICVKGATIYITMSPCMHCAALMIQSGISNIIYDTAYRDTSSLDYLINSGINVRQMKEI